MCLMLFNRPYITGMLYPDGSGIPDGVYLEEDEHQTGNGEDNEDFFSVSADEEEETEKSIRRFQQQTSAGIRFYVDNSVEKLKVKVSWGEYLKTTVERELEVAEEEIKKKSRKTGYLRNERSETVVVDFAGITGSASLSLPNEPLVRLMITKFTLQNDCYLVAVHLSNQHDSESDNDYTKVMFQVQMSISSSDQKAVFLPENICRSVELKDEYYYEKRAVYARGFGCAANWMESDGQNAYEVFIEFIPEHEICGVSPMLEGFSQDYFSMLLMAMPGKRDEVFKRLHRLHNAYNSWIDNLRDHPRMKDEAFSKRSDQIINECVAASRRIEKGINILEKDDTAFEAFIFMNQSMHLQRSIANYSEKYGQGIKCSLSEFTTKDHSSWRPFQLAFILLNMESCMNPDSDDRDTVDLLYFPTGGGKTEAYFGIIAFVIAYRRLTSRMDDMLEKDGGVTIILRYTLRLLTTQQRDRLTKLIIAAEMLRNKQPEKFGNERISIGFWVGGGVTPNKFDDFKHDPEDPQKSVKANSMLAKQLIKCPLCGTVIQQHNYHINMEKNEVEIFCSDENCYFFKYKDHTLPVYLVDEEIYRKCPTVIISTVDKFARLPWDEKTGLIFGMTDRFCERHGYLAIGEKHPGRHNAGYGLPRATVKNTKPFYPPELIIQDELHLITGPLGTIYGGYETAIEALCSEYIGEAGHRPKYVVSTATIKNAGEQIKSLYGREKFSQFPPGGIEISDSFFMKEVPLDSKPFRRYCGICAPGHSMKTTLLRVYAILLQTVYDMSEKEEYKDFIDPYYTLIGYFNSIRELGGTVRLLNDDIPARIERIKNKYGHPKQRFVSNRHREITSRMSSYRIAELLEQLSIPWTEKNSLHAAIATNMIAVGMDVDRLGLMTVTGQPKQNSEYIQATSRIGRKFPGLVVTVYNPYRPRDLSHYENFKGFHSQMQRFVEGTTATPFSARARDRVLHAVIVALLRLRSSELASNEGANIINEVPEAVIEDAIKTVLLKVATVTPKAYDEVLDEAKLFIEEWKRLSAEEKKLFYYIWDDDRFNRLLNYYGKNCTPKEKATLSSMREVEAASALYYYT
ncbi:MAG: DISARM system helicase DrmA [Bacillota bacterium]|nr:DISARM system helicase DrmA [Bacillota bacterium]